MIGERLELGLRHVAQVIEVHIIGAGPRSIGRGRLVKGLARRLFAERFDRFHLQVRLGQRMEEGGQPRLHRLHLGIDIGQIILAGRIIILRAGAQMLEKLAQSPFEPHLRHDLLHLAVDTCDFGETERVDLRRGHVGGRIIGEQRGIIGFAVGQAPDAVLRRRDRLLALHFGEQPAIGGAGAFRPCGLCRIGQPRLFAGVDVELADLRADILDHRIVRLHQIFDVADDIGIDPLRRLDALFGAPRRFRRQRVEHRAHAADALHIGFGFGNIGDAVDVDQKGRHLALRAVHLVEDIFILAEREQPLGARRLRVEQFEGQRFLRRQLRGVEARAHRGGSRLSQRVAGNLGVVARVVPLAVIGVADAAIGLALRAQRQLRLVIIVEELRKIGARRCARRGRLRRGRHGRRRTSRRRQQHERGGQDRGGRAGGETAMRHKCLPLLAG